MQNERKKITIPDIKAKKEKKRSGRKSRIYSTDHSVDPFLFHLSISQVDRPCKKTSLALEKRHGGTRNQETMRRLGPVKQSKCDLKSFNSIPVIYFPYKEEVECQVFVRVARLINTLQRIRLTVSTFMTGASREFTWMRGACLEFICGYWLRFPSIVNKVD